MAFSLKGFNAANVEERKDFELIPAGVYLAMIAGSEMVENKAKTGHYLKLDFVICEGDFENRHLIVRLNLDNPNELAVQIAQSELAEICKAVGVLEPDENTDLHDRPLNIQVAISPAKGDFAASNVIKKYMPLEDTAPKAKAAPTKSKAAPWAK